MSNHGTGTVSELFSVQVQQLGCWEFCWAVRSQAIMVAKNPGSCLNSWVAKRACQKINSNDITCICCDLGELEILGSCLRLFSWRVSEHFCWDSFLCAVRFLLCTWV